MNVKINETKWFQYNNKTCNINLKFKLLAELKKLPSFYSKFTYFRLKPTLFGQELNQIIIRYLAQILRLCHPIWTNQIVQIICDDYVLIEDYRLRDLDTVDFFILINNYFCKNIKILQINGLNFVQSLLRMNYNCVIELINCDYAHSEWIKNEKKVKLIVFYS